MVLLIQTFPLKERAKKKKFKIFLNRTSETKMLFLFIKHILKSFEKILKKVLNP